MSTKILFHALKPHVNLDEYIRQDKAAYKKIGAIYQQSISCLDQPKKIDPLLKHLGVNPDDRWAVTEMTSLLKILACKELSIEPMKETSVYKIYANENGQKNPVAMFKIGHKRAGLESLMRQFAFILGLEEYVVPSMICAMSDPEIKYGKNEETIEELWNGNSKCYVNSFDVNTSESSSESEEVPCIRISKEEEKPPVFRQCMTAFTVVGLIQPFLCPKASQDPLFNFAAMLTVAIAAGLGDGKEENRIGKKWIDLEQIFPPRIDPEWTKDGFEKNPPSLDLPLLGKNPMANELLSIEQMDRLNAIVQKWDIRKILASIREQKPLFYDQEAESMDCNDVGYDDGNCMIRIDPSEDPNSINVFNKDAKILNEEQLDACAIRLERLKRALGSWCGKKRRFTPKDVCFAVDLHAKVYYKTLHSDTLPPEVQNDKERFGAFGLLRIPPEKLNLSLNVPPKKSEFNLGHYRRNVSPRPFSKQSLDSYQRTRSLSPNCREEREEDSNPPDSPLMARG